jgi:hypothetical protein
MLSRNTAIAGWNAIIGGCAPTWQGNQVAHNLKGSILAIRALPVKLLQDLEPFSEGKGGLSVQRSCALQLPFDPIYFTDDEKIILFAASQVTYLFYPHILPRLRPLCNAQ